MAKQRELANVYRSIKPHVRAITQSTLVNPDFYKISLKAALAKSFDFNSYIAGLTSSSHSFYHTPTLRGICEDLIVLKAISVIPAEDRSLLVAEMKLKDMFDSFKKQKTFFQTKSTRTTCALPNRCHPPF